MWFTPHLPTVPTYLAVLSKKQSVDQVGLPILIYRQTTLLHPPPKSENTIAPVLVIAPTRPLGRENHVCSRPPGMRLAVEEGEPQVVLELLVVCLAHLEAGVGLIVEILVLLPSCHAVHSFSPSSPSQPSDANKWWPLPTSMIVIRHTYEGSTT